MRFFDLPFQLLLSLKKKKKNSHIRLCLTPWLLAKMATEEERIIQHFCCSHPTPSPLPPHPPTPATKVSREQTEQGHWAVWAACLPCSY